MTFLCNVFLSAGKIFPKQEFKNRLCALRFIGRNQNEPARFWVHGGFPHHICGIFTQALGALDFYLPFQLGGDFCLFAVGIGEIFILAVADFI